jgi:hypothetical protein
MLRRSLSGSSVVERVELRCSARAALPLAGHSGLRAGRRAALQGRLLGCLAASASWIVSAIGAGAATATLARQLGSVTYVVLGAFLGIVGALTHTALLLIRRRPAARSDWIYAWIASLLIATLLMGYLILRHPQREWVVESFAMLWMGFATPTAAICAVVANYLIRCVRAFRPL